MRIGQSREEFLSHLKEQYQFLKSSARAYDNGFIGEARRLAVVLRILLHDTTRSVSLLSSLDVKNSLDYFDKWADTNHEKSLVFIGVRMRTTENGLRYEANIEKPAKKSDFNSWWDGVAILNKKKNVRFSRGEIILAVANMDGGAHVDPSLDEAYSHLSRSNSIGWKLLGGGDVQAVENGPELSIVRQSAAEIEYTLSEQSKIILGIELDV